MADLFIKLFNMSITATWIAAAVILIRLFLKKAPKYITVFMWALVGLRLICPFSFESVLSLIPSAETLPPDIIYSDKPVIQSGIPIINSTINPIISESLSPNVGDSVNPMQVLSELASFIWAGGLILMLLYSFISYLRIRRKVKEAAIYEGNIWICDSIDTPFILGVIRPRIYLPSSLSDGDRGFVLAHERAHLKRGDHFWKPLGFLLLSVYWFNPVLWVTYVLLCKDIELATDEKVITSLGTQAKIPYSNALINCSVPKKAISACPVAFGENGLKERVIKVLNYKKPSFWIIIIAVISCIALAVFFLTNPVGDDKSGNSSVTDIGSVDPPENVVITPNIEELKEKYPEYFKLAPTDSVSVFIWQTAPDKYSYGLARREHFAASGFYDSTHFYYAYNTARIYHWESGLNENGVNQNNLNDFAKKLPPLTLEEAHAILSYCMVPTMLVNTVHVQDPTETYKYDIIVDYRNKADEVFWDGLKVYINNPACEFNLPNARVIVASVKHSDTNVKLGLRWILKEGFTESTKTEYPKYHVKITVGENSKFTFLPLPEEWHGDEDKEVVSTYIVDLPAKAGDTITLDMYQNDDKTFVSNLFKYTIKKAFEPLYELVETYPNAYSEFDIDGDGETEKLSLFPGYTSGLYTFNVCMTDKVGKGYKEYKNTFMADYYAPKRFCILSDGELYLESERFGDSKELRYYKIELEGDNIVLRHEDETLGYWGEQGIN